MYFRSVPRTHRTVPAQYVVPRKNIAEDCKSTNMTKAKVETQTTPLYPMVPIVRLRLSFNASGEGALPDFTGSTWRGALGHALRRLSCTTGRQRCEGCFLRQTCSYSYLFETPPPPQSDKMRLYTSVPHPFVLYPSDDTGAANAGRRSLELSLFGHGIQHLHVLLEALVGAARKGLGRDGGCKLALTGIETATTESAERWHELPLNLTPAQLLDAARTEQVPLCPRSACTLYLQSPLRLTRDGRAIREHDFSFAALFSSLLRRLSMLSYFHGDTALETDFAALTAAARKVNISHRQLQWHDWQRWSGRQHKHVAMGGLVGAFSLAPANINEFWPYLWLGQYTHAGKGTGMGLGRYRIAI